MTKTKPNLDQLFISSHKSHQPSQSQIDRMWHRIETNIVPPKSSLLSFGPTIKLGLTILILGIVFTSAAQADKAKPGDLLYPLDRLIEAIQVNLAPSPESKQELISRQLVERLEELDQLQTHSQTTHSNMSQLNQEIDQTLSSQPSYSEIRSTFSTLSLQGLTATESATLKTLIQAKPIKDITTETGIATSPTPQDTTEPAADSKPASSISTPINSPKPIPAAAKTTIISKPTTNPSPSPTPSPTPTPTSQNATSSAELKPLRLNSL